MRKILLVSILATMIIGSILALSMSQSSNAATKFLITTLAGTGGSISPKDPNVDQGTDKTFTITPQDCYHISDVSVDGVS